MAHQQQQQHQHQRPTMPARATGVGKGVAAVSESVGVSLARRTDSPMTEADDGKWQQSSSSRRRQRRDGVVSQRPVRPHVAAVWNSSEGVWQYGSCHPSGVSSARARCTLCRGAHTAQWCVGDKCCFVCGGKLSGARSVVQCRERVWPNRRCGTCVVAATGSGVTNRDVSSLRFTVTNTGATTATGGPGCVGSGQLVVVSKDGAVKLKAVQDDASVDCGGDGVSVCSSVSTCDDDDVDDDVDDGDAKDAAPVPSSCSISTQTDDCGDTASVTSTVVCAAAVAPAVAMTCSELIAEGCVRGDKLAQEYRSLTTGLSDDERAAMGRQCVRAVMAHCVDVGSIGPHAASWAHAKEFGSVLRVVSVEEGCGVAVLGGVERAAMVCSGSDCWDAAAVTTVTTAFDRLMQHGVIRLCDVLAWMAVGHDATVLRGVNGWLDVVLGRPRSSEKAVRGVDSGVASGVSGPAPSAASGPGPAPSVASAVSDVSSSMSAGTPSVRVPTAGAAGGVSPSVPSCGVAAVSSSTAPGRAALAPVTTWTKPSGCTFDGSMWQRRCDVSSVPEDMKEWEQGGLCAALLKGVASLGYERPSLVQRRVIPAIMRGQDVIAQAPSGTGKTCAYALPSLQSVDIGVRSCQVLVLVPTWELVDQVVRTFTTLASALPEGKLTVLGCSGASIASDDARWCREGAQVVVATPGKVLTLLQWGALSVSTMKTLVMDEGDEMLDRFQDHVRSVFEFLCSSGSFTGQVVCVSATVNDSMLSLCRECCMRSDNTVELLLSGAVNGDGSGGSGSGTMPSGLTQFMVDMNRGNDSMKVEALLDVLDTVDDVTMGGQIIVFCNANERVKWVTRELQRVHGMDSVQCLHGGMDAGARESSMAALVEGTCRLMVASDVTARGVDVQGVSAVVNFDVPSDVATYVHRVGRAGRFGRKGVCVTLMQAYREQKAVMREVAGLLGAPLRQWEF